jgi:hypothetical protein
MARKPSMETIAKLINRLNGELFLSFDGSIGWDDSIVDLLSAMNIKSEIVYIR